MGTVATVPAEPRRVRASVYLGMQEIILTLLQSASARAIAIEPKLSGIFEGTIETALKLFRPVEQPTPEHIMLTRCALQTGINSHEVAEYLLTGKKIELVFSGQQPLIESIGWAIENEMKARQTKEEKDDLRDPSVLTARVLLYACLTAFPAPAPGDAAMVAFQRDIDGVARLLQHAYPEDWLRAMLKMSELAIESAPLSDDEYVAMMTGHKELVASMQDELHEIEVASAAATAAFLKETSNGE